MFPYIPERWREVHRRALAEETIYDNDDCYLHTNGEQQWLRWSVRPWFQTDGTVGGIVIFSEDQTASKTLADRMALAGGVFANANDAIMITDASARIIDVNTALPGPPAGLAAIAVDSALMFKHVQRSNLNLVMAYDATIEGWSKALDLRDKETEGHTQRVTELTERLARRAGCVDADLIHIRRGAAITSCSKRGL